MFDALRAGWLSLLAVFVLVACGADGRPVQDTFDARCAQLPTTRYEVVAEPVSYRDDGSQSIDQLTVRSGSTPATHVTFGLTTSNFGHTTDIETQSVVDAKGSRACGTVHLRVKLSMQPMMVYIARELEGSPCAREATMEHELKHVAVFSDVLQEAARDLGSNIGAAFPPGPQRANSQAELEAQINAAVSEYMSRFIHERKAMLDARQNQVDSPEEHARVANACRQ